LSAWKNEDDIKAELRTLTRELRQLREELRGMVTPPKPSPSRALLLHRQSWPPAAADAPPAEAADSTAKRPSKRRKK
jgi:hypothetical protein